MTRVEDRNILPITGSFSFDNNYLIANNHYLKTVAKAFWINLILFYCNVLYADSSACEIFLNRV